MRFLQRLFGVPTTPPSGDVAAYRRTIVELLRLLADADAQLAYERKVPRANVPAELFCMWFDDKYHPDTDLFRQAFSSQETTALGFFDEEFEHVRAVLPSSFASVADLHAHAGWQSLMKEADETLRELGETP